MEIVVNLLDLSEVLVLHASTGLALGAVLGGVWEQDLVDYNVVDVDLLLGQLDRQSLRLVHREELGDADCNKRRLVSILELLVHLLNLCLHSVNAVEETLLHIFGVLASLRAIRVHHCLHLLEHATELVLQLNQLDETFFENVGEVEESEGVTRGRRVEDNQIKVVLVEGLDHLTEGGGLVDAWHARHQILHETH